jgi:hypothetical protein
MMKNKKLTYAVAKGVSALAITFSLGTGTVFADDQATTISGTTVNVTVQAPQKEIKEPSLIPGDFFYFVKVMVEEIRLALTVDDQKEAQLLAEFASERISEANELLNEGNREEAVVILKQAISTQELAEKKIPESTVNTKAEANGTNVISSNEKTDETEVESKLAHNIDSLLVVLEKIDNPKAQKVIMKNIQKSFRKIDKKLAKLEEAKNKFAEKMDEINEELESGEISADKAIREKAELEAKLAKKKQEVDEKEAEDVEKINKEIAKEMSEAKKEQNEKEQDTLKKAEELKREEAKKAEEKRLEEVKKAAEKQRVEIKKAREKQREHDEDEDDDDQGEDED